MPSTTGHAKAAGSEILPQETSSIRHASTMAFIGSPSLVVLLPAAGCRNIHVGCSVGNSRAVAVWPCQSAADNTMSPSFWNRRMFALCPITPAVRQAKVMSRSGSIQNSDVPAP